MKEQRWGYDYSEQNLKLRERDTEHPELVPEVKQVVYEDGIEQIITTLDQAGLLPKAPPPPEKPATTALDIIASQAADIGQLSKGLFNLLQMAITPRQAPAARPPGPPTPRVGEAPPTNSPGKK